MRNRCKTFCCRLQDSRFCCIAGAIAAGLVIIILFISGFSLLMTSLDASDELVSCMAAVSLCAGSFIAGFIAAKKRRKHGLLTGLLCGAVIYFAVFFFGLILLRSFAGAGTFMKLILIILCSCIGGVCGVNTRCRRPHK